MWTENWTFQNQIQGPRDINNNVLIEWPLQGLHFSGILTFHAGKLLTGTKTFLSTLHYRTNEPLLEYYCCKLRQAHLSHLSATVSVNYTQLNTVHMTRIHLAKVNTTSCPSSHPNFKMTIEKTIWLLAGLDCGSLCINRMTVILQIFLPYYYSGIPDCSTHAFIAERYLLFLLDVLCMDIY